MSEPLLWCSRTLTANPCLLHLPCSKVSSFSDLIQINAPGYPGYLHVDNPIVTVFLADICLASSFSLFPVFFGILFHSPFYYHFSLRCSNFICSFPPLFCPSFSHRHPPSVTHSFRQQQPPSFPWRCLIAGTSKQETAKIAEELQKEGELLPPAISHHPT